MIINTCLFFCTLFASFSSESTQVKVTKYHQKCNYALERKVMEDYSSAIAAYEEAFQIFLPFYDDMGLLLDCYKAVKDSVKYDSLVYTMLKVGYYTPQEYHIVCPERPVIERGLQRIPITFSGDTIENKTPSTEIKSKNARILETFASLESFIAYVRPMMENKKGHKYLDHLWISAGELLKNSFLSGHFANRGENNAWEDNVFAIHIIHILQVLFRYDTKQEEMDSLYTILWQQVLAGNLSPAQYAVFHDASGQKSLYGAFFKSTMDNKTLRLKMEFSDIENIENVDKRRAELLLPPLWVQAKRLRIDLPKDYKK